MGLGTELIGVQLKHFKALKFNILELFYLPNSPKIPLKSKNSIKRT